MHVLKPAANPRIEHMDLTTNHISFLLLNVFLSFFFLSPALSFSVTALGMSTSHDGDNNVLYSQRTHKVKELSNM